MVQGGTVPAKGPGRNGPRDSDSWRIHFMACLWLKELEEIEASGIFLVPFYQTAERSIPKAG